MKVVGKKFDSYLNQLELIPPEAVEGIGEVLTFGASKYGPDNWKHLENAKDRYFGAILRHLYAWRRGEAIDPDSGLSHMKHVAANASILTWFEIHQKDE